MIYILIILILCILLLLLADLIMNFAGFSKRCEGNENLKYFTASDFENLSAEPVSFQTKGGITLRGNIYKKSGSDDFKGIIVFCHGMGGGHLSYTTEINYFAQKGFQVFAYDNTGTCESDGKRLFGFPRSIIDLEHAVKYIESDKKLCNEPLFLVGHSWGAYTVCNLSSVYTPKNLKAIIAYAPFDSCNTLINDQSKQMAGISFKILNPFFSAVSYIKFGKYANLKSSKSISSNSVPTLIFHGDEDASVLLSNSPASKEEMSKNKNSNFVICKRKHHNPYLSLRADSYLCSVFGEIAKLQKEKKTDEIKAFYSSIDYSLITEEDEDIMKQSVEFLNKSLEK